MSRKASNKHRRPTLLIIVYSLIIGLCMALAVGFASVQEQRSIASKIVRLHVIPNSNSSEDQALKKIVRDDVTKRVNALLRDVSDIGAAEIILRDNIKDIEKNVREIVLREGYTYTVCAEICDEMYSTREYDTFTLPAGKYQSLRITIGSGKGENWWCVVFPPLCFTGAVEFQESAEAAGLSESEIKLISGRDEEGVVFRFQILELIKRISDFLKIS